MTEAEFWAIVKEVDWRSDQDYKRIKGYLLKKYPVGVMKEFQAVAESKFKALAKVVDKYVAQDRKNREILPYGGDDSFSDMVYHAIGNGEAYFKSVVAHPALLARLNVKESFSYAIPWPDDYHDSPEARRGRALAKLTAGLDEGSDTDEGALYQHIRDLEWENGQLKLKIEKLKGLVASL